MAKRRSTKAKAVTREGLYDQNSPANRARGRADQQAAKSAVNRQRRTARDGVGSSAQSRKTQAEKRKDPDKVKRAPGSTKAKAVAREGLYDQNSPANRARGRADQQAAKSAVNRQRRTARDGVGSSDQNRKTKAEEQQAEAKAKALKAQAKAKLEEAEKLKGKERRAARDEARRLEKQAELVRRGGQERQERQSREERQGGQGSPSPRLPVSPAPSLPASPSPSLPVSESPSLASAPISAPPVIRSAALLMQQACTEQAWAQVA